MNQKDGYNYSTLYYPRKEKATDDSCQAYWIATPCGTRIDIYDVFYTGQIQSNGNSYTYYNGLRPVVALKEGTKINVTEEN